MPDAIKSFYRCQVSIVLKAMQFKVKSLLLKGNNKEYMPYSLSNQAKAFPISGWHNLEKKPFKTCEVRNTCDQELNYRKHSATLQFNNLHFTALPKNKKSITQTYYAPHLSPPPPSLNLVNHSKFTNTLEFRQNTS